MLGEEGEGSPTEHLIKLRLAGEGSAWEEEWDRGGEWDATQLCKFLCHKTSIPFTFLSHRNGLTGSNFPFAYTFHDLTKMMKEFPAGGSTRLIPRRETTWLKIGDLNPFAAPFPPQLRFHSFSLALGLSGGMYGGAEKT